MGTLDNSQLFRLVEHAKAVDPKFDSGLLVHALQLYSNSLVVDLHLDTLLSECLLNFDLLERHAPDWQPKKNALADKLLGLFDGGRHRPRYNHADVPRMIDGGVNGAVFGIHWWPRSLLRMTDPYSGISRQFEALNNAVRRTDRLRIVRNPDDLINAYNAGVVAAMTGIEGLTCLGKVSRSTQEDRLEKVAQARRDHGIAYLTLNHHSSSDASENGWSMLPWDANADRTVNIPLDPFGVKVVRACNDAGVIVDLTHTNRRGILDACTHSRAPVIASHTALQSAVKPRGDKFQLRPLHDESAVAIARTGGVIGIVLCPEFLSDPDYDATFGSLTTVARHVREIISLVDAELGAGHGSRCCAIGSDFDGWIPSIPREMDGIEHLPLLAYFLKKEGLADQTVQDLLGNNFRRTWESVLSYAR